MRGVLPTLPQNPLRTEGNGTEGEAPAASDAKERKGVLKNMRKTPQNSSETSGLWGRSGTRRRT
jgi:hypothetical protein